MTTSMQQLVNSRPTIPGIVVALALVSLLGSMAVTPALSKDGDDRREHSDKGWHKGQWRGDRGEWRPVYREPYYYARPVYVPQPIYYPPQPSPGITLFFPLDVRVR